MSITSQFQSDHRKLSVKHKYLKLVSRVNRKIKKGTWRLVENKRKRSIVEKIKRYANQLQRWGWSISKAGLTSLALILGTSQVIAQKCNGIFTANTILNSFLAPGGNSHPTFVDIDGDGDKDLFVGKLDGTINKYENLGTAIAPNFATASSAGYNNSGGYLKPIFVDIDADGDQDLFIGEGIGSIGFWENRGDKTNPNLVKVTGVGNPLDGIDVGFDASISFVDFDVDGDYDGFIANRDGYVTSFRNDGDAVSANFVDITGGSYDPFVGYSGPIDFGYYTTLFFNKSCFADYLLVGDQSGKTKNFKIDDEQACPIIVDSGYGSSLGGIDVGSHSAPTFVDIDSDGDLDLFVGNGAGEIKGYTNTTYNYPLPPCELLNLDPSLEYISPSVADFDNVGNNIVGVGNKGGDVLSFFKFGSGFYGIYSSYAPFAGVAIGTHSAPVFADIDKDGDEDAIIGESVGNINFFRSNPPSGLCNNRIDTLYSQVGATNPFDTFDFGSYSTPAIVDIDGDGDYDAFTGDQDGQIDFLKNNGTAIAPSMTLTSASTNPLSTVDVGFRSAPSFIDIDADGDFDAFIGAQDGTVKFFENFGDATNPNFMIVGTPPPNPLALVSVGSHAKPSFIDIDLDGDMDAFVGSKDNGIYLYRNIGDKTNPVFEERKCPTISCADNAISGTTTGEPITSFQTYLSTLDLKGNGDLAFNSPGVWIKLFSNTKDVATLTTCDPGTNFNTQIHVFSEGIYNMITSNDDDGSCSNKSTVRFDIINEFYPGYPQPQTYYVFVSGKGTASGQFTLKVSCGSTCHNYKYYTNLDDLPASTHAATDIEINTSGNPILGPIGDVIAAGQNFLGNQNDVELIAGNSITLGPGFTTEDIYLHNKTFHAYIGGCTGPINAKDNTTDLIEK